MHLTDLLTGDDASQNIRDDNLIITGITSDSREVKPGYLFAALPGARVNGVDFIPEAIERGALAVLAPRGICLPEGADEITLIETENPQRQFAILAARYFGAQPENLVAVTGTNGKTSTVTFARQIWQTLGYKAASLGTLGVCAPGMDTYGSLTTPDPVTLHSEIADLAKRGITHLAMEASSHGLDQFRLDGVRLTAAGFTNLSLDHLDYHKDMQTYLDAKTRLFTGVLPLKSVVVLNADIKEFKFLKKECQNAGHTVLSYGYKGKDLKIRNRETLRHGQKLFLEVRGQDFEIDFPLVGEFQVYNALCALGLVLSQDVTNPKLVRSATHALEALNGVRGRLEHVATHPNGATIYVDYAHTPDALEIILKTLRPHVKNKLNLVIGAGGDRPSSRRTGQGKVASELADNVVVTDDNPRTEDPAQIRRQIIESCPKAIEIGDRRTAIFEAVNMLCPGDLLVIAGKGHEQGQIVGTDVLPFDDATVAREAVAGMKE